jgi:DNA repair protein RadD
MKKGEAGEMPIKICESCGAYNHTRVTHCCNCGEAFTFQVKIVSKAGTDELIKAAITEATPIIQTMDVLGAHYEKHKSRLGVKPPTLKVTYYTRGLPYREWICLEHTGLAGKMARDWWRKRHREEPPETIDAALLKISELRCPRYIRVHVNKLHPEIIAAEF